MTDLLLERFWEHVQVDPISGCWNWTAFKNIRVYGEFHAEKNKLVRAHRFSYQVNKGPIPRSLTIDHLCKNKACVNPEHLEAVSITVNLSRAFNQISTLNAQKTHCPQGHPYSGDNVYIYPDGRRHCRICRRECLKTFRNKTNIGRF